MLVLGQMARVYYHGYSSAVFLLFHYYEPHSQLNIKDPLNCGALYLCNL